MLVMLVMLSLWPQGTGWLLVTMADQLIGNTDEDHMLASASATKLLRRSKHIVVPLYQLLPDIIKDVLIKAALIILRLCHRWVCTSWVDPSAHLGADCVYHFDLNLWRGRKKFHIETTNSISACIIHRVINVCCIAHMLYCTSWTKLCRDPKQGCFAARQSTEDGHHSEGNEFWVDLINRWRSFHSPFAQAIKVCPVNKIRNFSYYKSKLALPNWSSRQWLSKEGTLN